MNRKMKKIMSVITIIMVAALLNVSSVFAAIGNWTFDADTEGWISANESQATVMGANGKFIVHAIGEDPATAIWLGGENKIDIDKNKVVRIKMKNETAGTTAQIYFLTETDQNWGEDKGLAFDITPNDTDYKEYVVDMSVAEKWNGFLICFRVDPTNGATGKVLIDSISIEEAKAEPAKEDVKAAEQQTAEGSKAVENTQEAAPSKQQNPKTGDAGAVMYVIGAGVSALALKRYKK